MSRIQKLFSTKPGHILNVYVTAGFPGLNDTLPIMQSLQQAGVDLIELGMPYSDPLADGPVIQQSSSVAIGNGMGIETLFTQLGNLRSSIHIPVVLMGYMNPVLQYGFEKFCRRAAEVGVDGLILPDLPIWEFEQEYQSIIRKHGLDFIFLVTPETSEERVRKIDLLTTGFLYAVSSSSTTGNEKNFEDVGAYLQRLAAYDLKNPILAGFGIKDRASFEAVCQYARGGIIGTAFIKQIAESNDLQNDIAKFVAQIR